MRAGRLRHRVDIQRREQSQDPETGEVIAAWVNAWAGCPASFEPLSARDLIAAQAGQSEATARVVIRYRDGVLPSMRIIHRGQIYNIEGPPLPDKVSGREYLTILVSTGLNDG
ncbi:phage head closure protein [Pseudomonas typographi]|uniref:Phage head closure protein n=1 Tax=Pseudomonas typographi TaxID=2715964 RepID=A0ABR7ZAV0_9PSED|nr:phage head closure protein [Pseudomonas typographi]MBD1602537.1 phage head closure protein [Pseudomonas typographi]